MAFSREWDDCYSASAHLSIWPWSDLVSLTHRFCLSALASGGEVYEMGCGAGANIPFFLSANLNYYASEGSQVIVDVLHRRYPELASKIVCCDFTKFIPFDRQFDLIVDRAALTHNSSADVITALGLVRKSLKPGSLYIGVDWFSDQHSDFALGERVDPYTRDDIPEGQFHGVGRVHYASEARMRELFSGFDILLLDHKTSTRCIPSGGHRFASWNIVAAKPL